jgi:G:T-mismatch repair DNA endonuclease (very short patch repair protein)
MLDWPRNTDGKHLIFWTVLDILKEANKDRDKFVNRELRKSGWKVVRMWEHELKSPLKVVAKLKKHY